MLPEKWTAFPEDTVCHIVRPHKREVSVLWWARRQPCAFPGRRAGRVVWERVAGRWE